MPRRRPRVVLLFANTAEYNSRAMRMTRTLVEAGYGVTWVARAAPGLPDREVREGHEVLRVALPDSPRWLPAPRLPAPGTAPGAVTARRRVLVDGPGRLLQALRYQLVVRRWSAAVERVAPWADVWQADGLVTLPLALRLRAHRGGRVLYDSLEIHVESGRFARLPRAWRWLLARRERGWARSADAVVTVSRPYADVLARRLGLQPVIVMNCPLRPATPAAGEPGGAPRPRRFHQLLGLDPTVPVVLYHGYLFAHRGIERLFEAMDRVPRAHLVVMGFGPRFDAYREQAAVLPCAGRVHVVPGVPPESLLEWVASADVAAMPIEGTTLNHRLTTPNKLFEALSAGVPVVASDLPGMAAILRETGAGLTCNPDDPTDIARALLAVLDASDAERSAYSARAFLAARATYNWETQATTYVALLRSLGGGGYQESAAPPGVSLPGHEPA